MLELEGVGRVSSVRWPTRVKGYEPVSRLSGDDHMTVLRAALRAFVQVIEEDICGGECCYEEDILHLPFNVFASALTTRTIFNTPTRRSHKLWKCMQAENFNLWDFIDTHTKL